jgi:hypothetical protein
MLYQLTDAHFDWMARFIAPGRLAKIREAIEHTVYTLEEKEDNDTPAPYTDGLSHNFRLKPLLGSDPYAPKFRHAWGPNADPLASPHLAAVEVVARVDTYSGCDDLPICGTEGMVIGRNSAGYVKVMIPELKEDFAWACTESELSIVDVIELDTEVKPRHTDLEQALKATQGRFFTLTTNATFTSGMKKPADIEACVKYQGKGGRFFDLLDVNGRLWDRGAVAYLEADEIEKIVQAGILLYQQGK